MKKPRDPYDISTWGPACGRGVQYKDMGPVTDGQKGAIRKISTGRKHRGMASDSVTASSAPTTQLKPTAPIVPNQKVEE